MNRTGLGKEGFKADWKVLVGVLVHNFGNFKIIQILYF